MLTVFDERYRIIFAKVLLWGLYEGLVREEIFKCCEYNVVKNKWINVVVSRTMRLGFEESSCFVGDAFRTDRCELRTLKGVMFKIKLNVSSNALLHLRLKLHTRVF